MGDRLGTPSVDGILPFCPRQAAALLLWFAGNWQGGDSLASLTEGFFNVFDPVVTLAAPLGRWQAGLMTQHVFWDQSQCCQGLNSG